MSHEIHNVFDFHEEELSWFFRLDENKINELIEAINTSGSNLSLKQIEKIMNLSINTGDAIGFRNALASLVHQFVNHKDTHKREISESYLDENQTNRITKFFEKLNENGLNGMDLWYEARYLQNDNILQNIGGEVLLKQILNEKDEIIGYLPFIHFRISVRDIESKKERFITFDINFDKYSDVINSLEMAKEDFLTLAKDYKTKLGDKVLLPED